MSLRMRPLSISERQLIPSLFTWDDFITAESTDIDGSCPLTAFDYAEQIFRTGLPGLRWMDHELLVQALDSYLYRSMDVPLQADGLPQRSIESLRQWFTAYAAASGTDARYNQILDAATAGQANKPDNRTTAAYRDRLASLWLLDPLPAWSLTGSPLSRLTRSPKHFVLDPGIALRALDLRFDDLLAPQSGELFGRLFEALAVQCVRVAAAVRGWKVGHLRTANGIHELDMVIQASAMKLIGVEVKLADRVTDADVKHLLWFKKQLGERCVDLVVLYAGKVARRRPDGVVEMPLALME